METVRWEELISDENWDNEERSDTELELNRDRLSKYAAKRKNEDPNKESRVIPHPEVGLSVSRTEASLEIKLAKKRPRTKRSKKSQDGLYEVLAPGSSVIKTDTFTSVIKEPLEKEMGPSVIHIWLNLAQRPNAKLNYNCMRIVKRKHQRERLLKILLVTMQKRPGRN